MFLKEDAKIMFSKIKLGRALIGKLGWKAS